MATDISSIPSEWSQRVTAQPSVEPVEEPELAPPGQVKQTGQSSTEPAEAPEMSPPI